MRAVVESMGPVPFQVQEMCQAYCDTVLFNQPTIEDEDARCELADKLLTDFAATCHPQTTGLDAISVAIVAD